MDCAVNESSSQRPPPRRAATRARLVEAARDAFCTVGYARLTMEVVAQLAGMRRSTVYLHFRDKDELLAAVAAEHIAKLDDVVALLPAPVPSFREVRRWLDEMTAFFDREGAATDLFSMMTHLRESPPAISDFSVAFQRLFADRLPAFDAAIRGGGSAHAWSLAVLETLNWALWSHARLKGGPVAAQRLDVAAELMSRFVAGDLPGSAA